MCTVSFVANKDHIIISSNRDENISRPDAKEIDIIQLKNNTRLYFPKDPSKGGSWFAVTNKGEVAVLLNGAFEKHTPSYPYSRSRGIVLIELLQNGYMTEDFGKSTLTGIEPFTIIYYVKGNLYEMRWDGIKKYCKVLSSSQSYIWSSATLYNAEARLYKENVFRNFILQEHSCSEKDMKKFHLQSNDDKENGFVIKRNNGIETRSLTQAAIYSSHIQLIHHTLIDNQTITEKILFPSSLQ